MPQWAQRALLIVLLASFLALFLLGTDHVIGLVLAVGGIFFAFVFPFMRAAELSWLRLFSVLFGLGALLLGLPEVAERWAPFEGWLRYLPLAGVGLMVVALVVGLRALGDYRPPDRMQVAGLWVPRWVWGPLALLIIASLVGFRLGGGFSAWLGFVLAVLGVHFTLFFPFDQIAKQWKIRHASVLLGLGCFLLWFGAPEPRLGAEWQTRLQILRVAGAGLVLVAFLAGLRAWRRTHQANHGYGGE